MKYLAGHDILGLTHTGTDGTDTPLGDWICVRALTRPHQPRDGGVALFVAPAMRARVSVVREHASLGILWSRVDLPPGAEGQPSFLAICYLPPGESTTYRGAHGCTREVHWDTLQADAAEFACSGQVVIMGDLNARTGRASDLDAGPVDADLLGAALPAGAAALLARPALPERRSMDAQVNPMGRHLLDLCRQQHLVILNGRLPRDDQGMFTYRQQGRSDTGTRGCSVIDYFIASPELAFALGGAPLPGCSLHVRGACFGEPRQFDHAPVSATIRWFVRRAPRGRGAGAAPTPPTAQWRWRAGLQEHYVPLLFAHPVQQAWGRVQDGMGAAEAVDMFMTGWGAAVQALHTAQGRVIVRAGGGAGGPQNRPANGWYDGPCSAARHALRAAEQMHGAGSPPARAARQAYRVAITAAKAGFEAERTRSLHEDLYAHPHRFWRAYKARAAQAPPGTGEQWRSYFQSLLQGNLAGRYVGGSFEAHCSHHAALFPTADTEAREAAACLNAPFTERDIAAGIAQLRDHKAAGPDGVTAEFIRHACTEHEGVGGKIVRTYVMSGVLTRVFNCILAESYPSRAWGVSALIPVPKPKGRPDLMDDYRGIAVGPVLAKLFAIVFLARLDRWAEAGGWRAVGQAGFRAQRGTPENCFVLRHVADAAAVQGRPLWGCFIDFSKAYDRVDRRLLWRCLEGMGVHGPALQVLQNMYEDVQLRVRVGGSLGVPFDSEVGVKQGCPLSPLLFGLFIDRLERWLARECPTLGARLAGQLLRALFYADDVVLLAESPEGLQALLQALEKFCAANGMLVNLRKSNIVRFGGGAGGAPPAPFRYCGSELEVKDGYAYLGLPFSGSTALPAAALADRLGRARKAMFAVNGRCAALGVHNVDLRLHLFDTLAASVLSHGCEVWGPDLVGTASRTGDFAAGVAEAQLHRPMLRMVLGVNKPTSVCMMMRELNREPFKVFWMRMAAKLWNRALQRGPQDWLRLALVANVQLAADAQVPARARQRLWAFHFVGGMAALGIQAMGPAGPQPICVTSARRAMLEKWEGREWDRVRWEGGGRPAWADSPLAVRAAPASFSQGFKLLVYDRWMARGGDWVRKESWTYHLQGRSDVCTVAKFRLGDHWLNVQRERLRGVARAERCCPRCPGVVEDEMHIMECPLYSGPRQRFLLACGGFVASDAGMRAAMNGTERAFWVALARFLHDCMRGREDFTNQAPPAVPS
jgi:hypothetical protein